MTELRGRRLQRWSPAQVYALYRLLLAALLVLVFLLSRDSKPVLGSYNPTLFAGTALLYLALALTYLALPALSRRFAAQFSMVAVLTDIVVLTLLVHASGGTGSSLTVLLIVTVAAACIILPGRLGLMAAAAASLTMMLEQFLFSLGHQLDNPLHLTESATLGLAFFAVALITQQVVQRLTLSEQLAERQLSAIHQLEILNQQVVNRMRTGVLVFEADGHVLLHNDSAHQLFPELDQQRVLPGALREHFQLWQQANGQPLPPLPDTVELPALDVGFARLPEQAGVFIAFLENRARVMQEAQQLKLASLGRLTATIAHEIRNPLSAIAQAAELLSDTPDRNAEDQHLLRIVQRHVLRLDGIVNDVLGLSRTTVGEAAQLDLQQALAAAARRFAEHGHAAASLQLLPCPSLPLVRFDAHHLEQVLDNLLHNAVSHGGAPVQLAAGRHPHSGLPWVSVRDHGAGISDANRDNVFEPFFTTSREGTGLGLFVCRGICESHQARLHFEAAEPGTRFIITFAHPDRVFR
ncbi:sensor histidine kinase [Isoalcanivorax beigongshangi]|uniref:histidine kinase n=1 Tax=Isoalcanivorax beigongshangi TaxID=3238810 RepID=A0ABV4AKN3_9GAMM